jgi:hypothetical protein
MEAEMGMPFHPCVAKLEFMVAQGVDDDVDLLSRMAGRDRIQKVREFIAPIFRKALRPDLSGGHIQRREKSGRSTPLVFLGECRH